MPTRDSSARAETGAGAARSSPARAGVPARPDGLVVGPVPGLARLAGGLLLGAGVAGVASVFPAYLVVAGRSLSQATGVGGVLVAALVPAVHLAVGVLLVRGLVPKFGLAYAAVVGALAAGQLLLVVAQVGAVTGRPPYEVVAGRWVLTSSVAVGAGWVLTVVALGATVLAGLVAGAAWSRTVMDDDGTLDPLRPRLAGAAALLGVATVLCLALPAADLPQRTVVDPGTGLQEVLDQQGAQALLERSGTALVGGLLLAATVVLCAALAPSLRPRLAAVGGLLAVTVVVLAAGLTGLRDAVLAPELDWTLPGAGLLLAGLGCLGLTWLAWRPRRSRPVS